MLKTWRVGASRRRFSQTRHPGTDPASGHSALHDESVQIAACACASRWGSFGAGTGFGGIAFQPYSDFLVHDMGARGDRIGNAGDSLEITRRMRTAPLWGIRYRTHLLHDGRTTDIAEAIRAHDGQGNAAKVAFERMSRRDQRTLIALAQSL